MDAQVANEGLSLTLFRAFEHTWISTAIRQSKSGFAIIEMVHLIALALFGAAVLLLALRTLGAVLRTHPLARVTQGVASLLWGGFALLVFSGALLLADGPLRYYANVAFRTKMALIVAALPVSFAWYRAARRAPDSEWVSLRLQTAAGAALALWVGVGLAGRLIGVL